MQISKAKKKIYVELHIVEVIYSLKDIYILLHYVEKLEIKSLVFSIIRVKTNYVPQFHTEIGTSKVDLHITLGKKRLQININYHYRK